MKLSTLLSLNLFVFAIACGSSSEEGAAEAAVVAGQATSALASTSALSADAAEVQQPSGGGDGGGGGRDLIAPEVDPCGMLRWEGDALVIDYGAGCTSNGVTFSGSYSIRLSLVGGVSVVLSLDDLGIDDKTYRGEAAAAAGKGRVSGTMDLTITEGTVITELAFDGTMEGTELDVSFDGAGSFKQGTVSASYDASDIHQKRGDCYPDAGTVVITTPLVEQATVTFSANTPITGEVTVRVGSTTVTYQLPIKADCAIREPA